MHLHNIKKGLTPYIFFFIGTLVFVSRPAYAYIDPGTGSYVVQLIIASVTSFILFFIKPAVGKLKKIFKKDLPINEEAEKKDEHE